MSVRKSKTLVYKGLGFPIKLIDVPMKKMFGEIFSEKSVTTEKYGNVLTASSFLYGLGVGELKKEEYDFMDPDYPVIITVRATK